MSTSAKILKLEQQRRMLIQQLIDTQAMVRGSFGTAYRKCGNPNCWCAEGAGHPVNRITWSEEGRSRTKAIPDKDVDWAKQMADSYKRFRKNRQALRALERKINLTLDELEATVVGKTTRKRGYEI